MNKKKNKEFSKMLCEALEFEAERLIQSSIHVQLPEKENTAWSYFLYDQDESRFTEGKE